MAFVMKFIKTLKNHWKKSTFAACTLGYGVNYAKESYQIQQLMHVYCEEARKFGIQSVQSTEYPRRIIVILNPNANRRKAVKQFESYCAPILHLGGISVNIIQTKSEGHARTLIEDLKENIDAIIIAGGDGTISECVTGLMRRADNYYLLESCSIGVLPLGRINMFAQTLFSNNIGNKKLKNVQNLADASLAIVKKHTTRTNVMKIQILTSEKYVNNERNESEHLIDIENKPVYALSNLEWGSYRDAQSKKEKYWYFGSLRNYATYIFNGLKSNLNWNCKANITYSPPCSGCNNCFKEIPFLNETNSVKQISTTRWWGSFVPKSNKNVISNQETTNKHLKNIINENCSNIYTKSISTTDFTILAVSSKQSNVPQLMLNIGPDASDISYLNFVKEGWNSENGKQRNIYESFNARQIELIPQLLSDEFYYSIDNEEYEVKPVRITLLPNILKVFCNTT